MSTFDEDFAATKAYYDELRAVKDKVQELERMQVAILDMEIDLAAKKQQGLNVQLPAKPK